MRPTIFVSIGLATATGASCVNKQPEAPIANPILPGWHSDPSCVFVAEWDNTTFCTVSSFLSTPGLPIMASKDLVNWKLVSHALTRRDTIPEYDQTLAQSDGIWAATIRYHAGKLHIATIFTNTDFTGRSRFGLIVQTSNPFDDEAWSDPKRYDLAEGDGIDPDLFWDDDGQAYLTSAGISTQTIDLDTAALGPPVKIWNGTSGAFLEGPHVYRRDNFYYLMVAEGGSGLNHSVTIARSRNITGPYESDPANPVLTNRNTTKYFQNIGHADLFQDAAGEWWSSALAWRSGPAAIHYPMGRETVLTSVRWEKGEWPEFQPVSGVVSQRVAKPNKIVKGKGPFVGESDRIDFAPGSELPRNFIYWRWPEAGSYTVSPKGHPNELRLTPSFYSITDGYKNLTAGFDIGPRTLIARKQTDTLFRFSIDVAFAPTELHEEVGITAYLNQVQNHALGLVNLPTNQTNTSSSTGPGALHFRFITSATGSLQNPKSVPILVPVPDKWAHGAVRMYIHAQNETHYVFSAAPVANLADERVLAFGDSSLLSGGQEDFTGEFRPLLFQTFAIFLSVTLS